MKLFHNPARPNHDITIGNTNQSNDSFMIAEPAMPAANSRSLPAAEFSLIFNVYNFLDYSIFFNRSQYTYIIKKPLTRRGFV